MNRKMILLSITAAFIFLGSAFAQENQLDSILVKQNQLLEGQQNIKYQVTYRDPLAGKRFGIEFNPAYFFVATAADHLVLSGGFSLFDVNPKVELAFPVYIRTGDEGDHNSTLITLDAHYRYFLGEHRKGFYLSGGARYAYINGADKRYENLEQESMRQVDFHKFGILFGIGYRIYSHSGFYWGTSLSVGRYFSDQSELVTDAGLDASKLLMDIELLKFGYAF